MTNLKLTKRALLSSVVATFLCLAMLLGTTFAWFTDTVTSANNVIMSGNLDITLEYFDGKEWKDVEGASEILDPKALWEPGYTEVAYFRFENAGSLALKYSLGINIISEKEGVNAAGDTFKLSDYIYFDVIDDVNGETDAFATRAEAMEEVENASKISVGYTQSGYLLADTGYQYLAMVVYMPDSVGNVANHDGKTIPQINLGVNIMATQYTSEKDSFDENYDKGATLPWDGTEDLSWYDPTLTTYELYSAEALAGFAAIVNGTAVAPTTTYATASATSIQDSFAGKTVKLGADLDLAGKSWTPIGQTGAKQFAGTFDGNGKTISNLYIDNTANTSEYGAAGLFGWVEQHSGSNSIKNLTIDGAVINSHRYTGAIAGWINIPVTDCTVKNVTINCTYYNDDTDGTKVGALVGYADNKSNLTGNTVDTAKLTAYGDVGGLVGVGQTTVSIDANTVKNVTITYTSDVKSVPGEIASTRVTPVYGTNTVDNVKIVKAVTATTPDDFAGALNGYDNNIIDKNISIVLTDDLDIDIGDLGQQTGGSGEYKLGTAETETIIIDLNGHKLNIKTTYWSAIGAQNPDAVFTIKNGTMTSTGNSAGTWNAWDLRLCNCNYVIENVTFEKAVALDNAGKSTTMKNVTITDSHNTDTYALWITSEGQTVNIDGLTIDMLAAADGRGIKIDNQYVNSSSKVTLSINNATFKTEEKGAIVVKSPAGADITLSNINIEDVIDATNAVWVDEDAEAYADLVTVTGGTKINESTIATNTTELNKALSAGKTELFLTAGEYDVNNGQGKTLTLTGLSDKTVIKVVGGEQGEAGGQLDYGLDGSTVTFNNLTIKTNNATYAGYARLTATYNNCVFDNCYCLNGNSTFTECTFNVSGDQYNVWTWGAPTATFTKCTFNSDGKAVLLYGTANTKLTLNDCTFNDTGVLPDLKAAVEIGNDYNKSYELIVNNATVNGYEINDKGISTGTTLWANKNSMSPDKLNVVVDGVDVY